MCQRDVGLSDFDKNEEMHANAVNYSILKNVLLTVQPELKVTVRIRILETLTINNTKQQNKTPQKSGHVDLVITNERHVTVIVWKVIKIDFLEIEDATTNADMKFGNPRIDEALTLSKFLDANELLKVKFGRNDKWRRGKTIGEWVHGSGGNSLQSQITRYFKSPEITKLVNDKDRLFHGHLVLVVGNRKVLIWDVDDGGKLGDARLIEPWASSSGMLG
jgi:hypothetical protein